MKKLNPVVEEILKRRYDILLEKEELGSEMSFGRAMRKAKAKNLEELPLDISDVSGYTDWAYENVPGVKGMAQSEVPMSATNKKEYEKLRSELATQVVKARKTAFDEKEEVDEKEILLRALAKQPELSKVLTRDEYTQLAGDITRPLNMNIEVETEKGNKVSTQVAVPKWGGITDNSAMLYDFLRGAQKSMTTPEGIASGMAFGAGFKALGMGAGALGKALAPTAGKYIPGFVRQGASQALPSIGRARAAAEKGSAAGQAVVGAGGLGLMTLGGMQAAQGGKFSEYAGQIAGGVAPFAAGGKAVEVGVPAAAQAGKFAGKQAIKATEPVIDVATDIAQQQQRNLGAAKEALQGAFSRKNPLVPRGGVKIRRISDSGFENLSPTEQLGRWKSGEGAWTPGQPFDPYFGTARQPSRNVSPKPDSAAAATVAATTAGVLTGALSGAPAPMRGAEVTARTPGIVSVEAKPSYSEPGSLPGVRGGGSGTRTSGVKQIETMSPSGMVTQQVGIQKGGRSGTVPASVTATSAEQGATVKIPSAKTVTPSPANIENKNINTQANTANTGQTSATAATTSSATAMSKAASTAAAAGGGGGGGGSTPPEEQGKRRKKGEEEAGRGGVPPVGFGLDRMGGPQSDDYENKRMMASTDINAILSNLFRTAQTIRIA